MSPAAGPVVCIGELLIDFVPGQPGVSVRRARSFGKAAGGAPANVAAAIARLGGKSAFIGRVGADAFGLWLRDELAAAGVDVSGVVLDEQAATTLAFVSLAGDADRDFMFYRDGTADTRLQPADVPEDLLKRAAALHFCSVSLSVEPARSATLHAVRLARSAGVPVSFDINWRAPLWNTESEALPVIREAISLTDILKLSESELELLTGSSDPAGALGLLNGQLQLVVLSLGADGLLLVNRRGSLRVTGLDVSAVDTTGAGDALAGGLLHALALEPGVLEDDDALLRAATRANALAALSTLKPGAIPSYPDRAELDAFLREAAKK